MKYGEDEETFSLQRAETGDARLNREHQSQRVNQQKEAPIHKTNNQVSHRPSSADREIFKGSSSSNFYNNRNGGKETEDDDYEPANANANQDNDAPQRRKIIRKQGRRPYNNQNENTQQQQHPQEARTSRPSRPTGFTNNFAGSSPTTARSTAAGEGNNNEQFGGRRNPNRQRQDNFSQTNSQQQNSETPAYVVSTPAPFRQTQQYNNINRQTTNNQYNTQTTQAPKTTVVNNRETENYPAAYQQKKPFYNQQQKTENYQPSTVPATQYNTQYEATKVKQTKQTENYPSTLPQNKATTLQPKANFQNNARTTQFNNQRQTTDNLPTTFAPRTNAAYTQIAQQTTQYRQPNTQQYNNQNTQQYNNQNTQQYNQNPQHNNQQQTTQYNNAPTTYNQQQYDSTRTTNPQTTFNQQNTTPKTVAYTQYTPTVPKITTTFSPSTTVFARSNRFDETQYDDGSYSSKYDNYDNTRRDDELIKTAHSTNIASSRNEFAKNNNKNIAPQSTPKPYYESPRPFSVSPATPKTTQVANQQPKTAQKPVDNNKKAPEPAKKQTKNVSYDYAYYDTNSGSEIEYDIPTEIEKSAKVTKKQ